MTFAGYRFFNSIGCCLPSVAFNSNSCMLRTYCHCCVTRAAWGQIKPFPTNPHRFHFHPQPVVVKVHLNPHLFPTPKKYSHPHFIPASTNVNFMYLGESTFNGYASLLIPKYRSWCSTFSVSREWGFEISYRQILFCRWRRSNSGIAVKMRLHCCGNPA